MRLAILADIHGNYQALQAVLTDIARLGADKIVSLGDNIGYGPEPVAVVETLRMFEVISVLGNHELALISQSYALRLNESARISLDLTRSLLDVSSLTWLASLPLALVQGEIRLVHACPPRSATVYLHEPSDNRLARLFASYPERLCFAGHTHDFGFYQWREGVIDRREVTVGQRLLTSDVRYLLLPGSVGQPRDRLNAWAKYMLWDQATQTLIVRAVEYDVATTVRLLAERGFPVVNARRLVG